MRILVLGGTGAMGKALVNLLLKENHHLTVTTRSSKNGKSLEGGRLVYLKGDAHDVGFILSVLSTHWDVIIDFMIYSTEEFKNRMSLLLNATDQYFFLSSARVYSDHSLITEESKRLLDISQDLEYVKTDEYALAKARQENLLLESTLSNWTVIRPYITFSEERLQLGVFEKEDWLYRALHGRTIVFSRDIGTKSTTLTYGEDVARGIISLIGNKNSIGKLFHIATEMPIRWDEVVDIYLKVLSANNIHSKVHWIENMGILSEIMGNQYQVKYDRLFDRNFDSTKIKEYAGSSFDFSNSREKLAECLESFLGKPEFKNINWKTQAYMDRITGEFVTLNEIKDNKNKIKYFLFRFFPISFILFLRSVVMRLRKLNIT